MSDTHPDLMLEIKLLIIDALGLEDISAQDIGNDQTLFGEGLGLDSVDALELGLAIQKSTASRSMPTPRTPATTSVTWRALRRSSLQNRQLENRPCKPVTTSSTPCAMPWSNSSNWSPSASASNPTCTRTWKSTASTRST